MLRSAELAPEAKRRSIAFYASLIAIPVIILISSFGDEPLDLILPAGAIGMLLVIVINGAVYVTLTWRAFQDVTPEALAPLLALPPELTSTRWGRANAPGPGIGVQFAVVALLAAAVLPRVEQFVADGPVRVLLVAVSTAAVLVCWVLLHVSYALHYARLHTNHGGLDFPGEEQPAFVDYLYFSLAVATSVGATDVAVTTRALRRVVAGHSVLSFAFNTGILAIALAALAA